MGSLLDNLVMVNGIFLINVNHGILLDIRHADRCQGRGRGFERKLGGTGEDSRNELHEWDRWRTKASYV